MDKPDVITVAFDTCVGDGSASVWKRGRLLAQAGSLSAGGRRLGLLSVVEGMLTASGLTIRDVAKIVLTNGPGSYTGVRTGIANALGLRRSLGTEIDSCTVFEAFTMAVDASVRSVLTMIRAGKDEYAIREFQRDARGLFVAKGISHDIIDPDGLAARLNIAEAEAIVAEEALVDVLQIRLAETLPAGIFLNAGSDISVLAYRFIQNTVKDGRDRGDLRPLYTREFTFGS